MKTALRTAGIITVIAVVWLCASALDLQSEKPHSEEPPAVVTVTAPPATTAAPTSTVVPTTSTNATAPLAVPVVGVDARANGARGDGVADDTAALQRTFDVAQHDASHTAYIPSGVYLISAALRYDSQTTIVGDGMAATTIRNVTTRTDHTAMLEPRRTGVSGVIVKDLTLDQRGDWYDRGGEGTDSYLFDVGSTSGVTVQRVGFRNVRTMALYADTPSHSPTTGLVAIDNHVFESNGGGFSFFGSLANFTIANNLVEHTKDDAIAVQDHAVGDYPTNVTITDNTILNCTTRTVYGSTANGINVWGGDNVRVENNTISYVLANGVRAGIGNNRRGTNIQVLNNSITGAGTNGSRDVPGNGIFVIGADHVTVRGNRISGSRQSNFFAKDSTDVTGP